MTTRDEAKKFWTNKERELYRLKGEHPPAPEAPPSQSLTPERAEQLKTQHEEMNGRADDATLAAWTEAGSIEESMRIYDAWKRSQVSK